MSFTTHYGRLIAHHALIQFRMDDSQASYSIQKHQVALNHQRKNLLHGLRSAGPVIIVIISLQASRRPPFHNTARWNVSGV